jgi:hypothetical protein
MAAGAGPERDTQRVLVWAGLRGSVKWRREALTAMLACAAVGRTDAAHGRHFFEPRGGGRGAAGEGRRREGEE